MASSNSYAKTYLNRRLATEVELYKLILFPADNSIAVVKSKQCSPAEHDGFFHVQSGRRRFTGVVLEEGDLAQCSEAADRLEKKQVNPEIESDYERGPDENQSTQITNLATTSTITTLKNVPFGVHSSNVQPIATSLPSATRSNDRSGTTMVIDLVDGPCQRTAESLINPMAGCSSVALSPANLSSVLGDTNNLSKRPQKHVNASKSKHQKHHHKEKATVRSFDDDDDEIDSSNDGEDEDTIQKKQSSIANTPAFAGQRVVSHSPQPIPTTRSTVSSMIQQLLAATSKLESQYLRPLVVAQERTEAMTKCLFINQKKIQKTLRKQKMNIALVSMDESNETADDQSFSMSLEYTSPDGISVDLLKRPGVKEHANRYVTSLMDLLYKPEELVAMQTVDVPKDERYLLLKEAVRHKFRLSREELETMWIWLHTVFLAKRRTLGAKKRQQTVNMITN